MTDSGTYRMTSRLLDLAAGLAILILLWWLMLIIWVVIRTTSPGPGFFKQMRVGKHQKAFTCYKFRTMRQNTKQAGTHEVAASSVTGVGKFLRKTKLDELPQFINLLIGNMSVVGPRPCLLNQKELIVEREKRGVFAVKPGITGLAQVNSVDMSQPVALAELDQQYVATRSVLLDIKLILMSVFGHGSGDNISA